MINEKPFRTLCRELFITQTEFLSVLFGKITICYGTEGLIDDASKEEGSTLKEIGFIEQESVYYIDPADIKTMLTIQKEERKNYHIQNQIHMKLLLMDTFHNEISKTKEIDILVDGEQVFKSSMQVHLSQKAKEQRFQQYIMRSMKNEGTRIMLGELLQYFEEQLLNAYVCELVINDAELTADGDDFLIESVSVFCHVLSLIPHMEKEEKDCFSERNWSLGSVIDDTVVWVWIRIMRREGVKRGYVKMNKTSRLCIHKRVRKSWCFW